MIRLAVIACGSRDWTDCVATDLVASRLPPDSFVIHGDCRGADLEFERSAAALGHDVLPVPARWEVHGLKAGPIRNSAMLRILLASKAQGFQVCVIAFHDDPGFGVGTEDMVKKAKKRGVPVIVVTHG